MASSARHSPPPDGIFVTTGLSPTAFRTRRANHVLCLFCTGKTPRKSVRSDRIPKHLPAMVLRSDGVHRIHGRVEIETGNTGASRQAATEKIAGWQSSRPFCLRRRGRSAMASPRRLRLPDPHGGALLASPRPFHPPKHSDSRCRPDRSRSSCSSSVHRADGPGLRLRSCLLDLR